jgi:hypothetical protein
MGTERRTDFPAPKGGVMTDEVGAITGDLTLRTEVDDQGCFVHRVQYKDADEWYAVTGLPAGHSDADIEVVHAQALAQVSGPAAG